MMIVRRMMAEDRPAAAAIEKLCFSCPESEQSLALYDGVRGIGFVVADIPEPSHLCTMCAPEEPTLIAHGTVFFAPDEGQIINIATHPDHRRKGAARKLMEAIIDDAKARGFVQLSLEVRVGNIPAIELYRSYGFTIEGTRKNFYRCPTEDAYVMLKNLT